MSATVPSLAQMVTRANQGHMKALVAIDQNRPLVRPGALESELRGIRVVLSTLRRWGLRVRDGNGPHDPRTRAT